jgi:hypothetical protein
LTPANVAWRAAGGISSARRGIALKNDRRERRAENCVATRYRSAGTPFSDFRRLANGSLLAVERVAGEDLFPRYRVVQKSAHRTIAGSPLKLKQSEGSGVCR